jgi:hypothetical protein
MADMTVKEVFMEVGAGIPEEEIEEGGEYATTRRRRRRIGGGRRRRTARAAVDASGGDVAVHKEAAGPMAQPIAPVPSVLTTKPPVSAPSTPSVSTPSVAAVLGAKPQFVIAPPKKKPAKVMLVPKKIGSPLVVRPQKTFKAKRVRVVIDNTAKTQKRRRLTLQEVDALSEEDLRMEAVRARLSKPETVAKVPVDLLRQMLKDYRMMRGMLL